MAKDPAFLFYPNDWLGSTLGWDFEAKGAYFELLMTQFNRGHMSSDMIAQVVGHRWDKIKSKFIQDDNGLWYNQRLEFEQQKRKAFTESRRNNTKGHNQYNKKEPLKEGHMTSHMENENENRIEIIGNIKNSKGETQKSASIDPGAFLVPRMFTAWKGVFPKYLFNQENDFPALHDLAHALCDQLSQPKDFSDKETCNQVLVVWHELASYIRNNSHFSNYNLQQVRKYIQSILQGYNKPTVREKSGIQYLYERFCEDGKVDYRLITEDHYQELFQKKLVAIDEKLVNQVTKSRLKALDSPMNLEERQLHDAYKAGNPDHPLLIEDRKKIELNAKRTAVISYFKGSKAASIKNILASKPAVASLT